MCLHCRYGARGALPRIGGRAQKKTNPEGLVERAGSREEEKHDPAGGNGHFTAIAQHAGFTIPPTHFEWNGSAAAWNGDAMRQR
jgi:hypothetical protein